jgi:hypothetical protein
VENNVMEVGDLITTYYKGFFRLNKIERRFYTQEDIDIYYLLKGKKAGEEYSPLYYFTQEYDSKGNPSKNPIQKWCDAQFCKLANEYITEELQKLEDIKAKLLIIHGK